jgi:hypothetical protein
MNPIGRGTVPFYSEAVAVTPDDGADIAPTLAVQLGTGGDLTVDMVGIGTNVTLSDLPAGIHKLAVTRVYATNTSAAAIVALRA